LRPARAHRAGPGGGAWPPARGGARAGGGGRGGGRGGGGGPRAAGGAARAVALRADVGRPREALALVAAAVKRLGRLDVLVNNAALFFRTPVETTTPAQFDRLLAVNLRAPFFCSQAAVRAMGRHGGRIVNIADVGAVRAWAAYVPYGVTK